MKRIVIYVLLGVLPLGVWGQTETFGVDFQCEDCDFEVIISPEPAVLCGESITLNVEVEGAIGTPTITWSDENNSNSNSILVDQVGNYSVTVTDENNCTMIASVDVESGFDSEDIKRELENNDFYAIPIQIAPAGRVENNENQLSIGRQNSEVENFSNLQIILDNEQYNLNETISNFFNNICDRSLNAVITDNENYCIDNNFILFERMNNFDSGYLVLAHIWQSNISNSEGLLFIKVLSTYEDLDVINSKILDTGEPTTSTYPTNEVRCCNPLNPEECERVDFILREDWNARAPVIEEGRLYNPITSDLEDYYFSVVIHHAGNNRSYPSINDVQNQHIDEKFRADIGYHFGIDKDGNVFEGRKINIQGSHVDKANTGRIGIVLLGDFDPDNECLNFLKSVFELTEDDITTNLEVSTISLIRYLKFKYNITRLEVHNQIPVGANCTRCCPGSKVVEKLPTWRALTGLDTP